MYLRLQRAPTLKRCESVKGSAWCCDLLLLQLRGCFPPCVPQSQTQGDLVVHETDFELFHYFRAPLTNNPLFDTLLPNKCPKRKKETLKDFRHSLIQERPALSLPVLFLISFFLNDLSRIQILSSVMPSPLPSFPSSWHKATLAVGRGCIQPNVASRVCLYAYSSAGLH